MATPRVKTLADLIARHEAIDSALSRLIVYPGSVADLQATLEDERRKTAESIARQYDLRYLNRPADQRPMLLSDGHAHVPVTDRQPFRGDRAACLGIATFTIVYADDLPII